MFIEATRALCTGVNTAHRRLVGILNDQGTVRHVRRDMIINHHLLMIMDDVTNPGAQRNTHPPMHVYAQYCTSRCRLHLYVLYIEVAYCT
jgi:hypothetical protein